MTVHDALFACLGLICAAGAVRAVTTCQIVHAALWLTLSLAALSGCYLVLGAELVALVQLLVYVGAVVVLVLFAVMLTRSPIGKSADHDVPMAGRMAAFVVAAATGGLLFAAFTAAFGTRGVHLDAGSNVDLATSLFGRFTWPFEALSLVLLAALVGALAMIGQRPRSAQENATRPARPSLRTQLAAATAKPATTTSGATAVTEQEPAETANAEQEPAEPDVAEAEATEPEATEPVVEPKASEAATSEAEPSPSEVEKPEAETLKVESETVAPEKVTSQSERPGADEATATPDTKDEAPEAPATKQSAKKSPAKKKKEGKG